MGNCKSKIEAEFNDGDPINIKFDSSIDSSKVWSDSYDILCNGGWEELFNQATTNGISDVALIHWRKLCERGDISKAIELFNNIKHDSHLNRIYLHYGMLTIAHETKHDELIMLLISNDTPIAKKFNAMYPGTSLKYALFMKSCCKLNAPVMQLLLNTDIDPSLLNNFVFTYMVTQMDEVKDLVEREKQFNLKRQYECEENSSVIQNGLKNIELVLQILVSNSNIREKMSDDEKLKYLGG